MSANEASLTRLFERVTGDEDSRMCRDISDEACQEQPGNFFRHLVAALGNKLADELSNARLILPWLMGAIGAPVWMVGLLVPIREAGALLPQLLIAGYIRLRPIRKWVWVTGGIVQAETEVRHDHPPELLKRSQLRGKGRARGQVRKVTVPLEATAAHQDVCGLHAAVQHAVPVHAGQAAEHGGGDVPDLFALQRRRLGLHQRRQGRVVKFEGCKLCLVGRRADVVQEANDVVVDRHRCVSK